MLVISVDDGFFSKDVMLPLVAGLDNGVHFLRVIGKVFFKDSNIILKYSILGDCFGLKQTCL